MIRDANLDDAPALVELIAQLGYATDDRSVAQNLEVYRQQEGWVLVEEQEGVLRGFVSAAFIPLFHASEAMCRITAMCVAASSRKAGVGRALVSAVETRCSERNCRYFEVTSGAHRSDDAHVFYQKLGYTAYPGKRFIKRLP